MSNTQEHPRIERARAKARQVRHELDVAGGEMHLSNTILERALPDAQKQGDVGKALEHSGTATERVVHAREELEHIEELLEQEAAERHAAQPRRAN